MTTTETDHRTTPTPLGTGWVWTGWVCIDCFVLLVNAEAPLYHPDTGQDMTEDDEQEWLDRVDLPLGTTPGMMADDHDRACPAFDDGETTGNECHGCEEQDFSWSTCDSCRSHLGGSRHAVTYWEG